MTSPTQDNVTALGTDDRVRVCHEVALAMMDGTEQPVRYISGIERGIKPDPTSDLACVARSHGHMTFAFVV